MFDESRTRALLPSAGSVYRSRLRRFIIASLGSALVPMLCGCIFTDRPELGVDIPPVYGAGRGEALPPKLDWWRGFRSAELVRLIEEAQTQNYDIATAIGLIAQADAQAKIASVALFPIVTLNATSQHSRPSQTTGPGGTGSGGPSEIQLYQAVLNASYEVDFWGKNRAASRAAQETAVASRFSKEVVVLSTITAVATSYFIVLASQDELRVARRNLDASGRILTLIKQRQEAGTASQLDVAQQESLVATIRASIPPLDQILRQNIAALALLIGRPPIELTVRGGSLERLAIPRVTPGMPSELLRQRPDIRMNEAILASTNASVENARAQFFPSITLTGQGGYASSVLKLLLRPESALYSAATNLTQPLLDGFRLEGQLELAKGQQLTALQTYRKSILSAFTDVEKALIAVADTTETERLQIEVVRTSRQAFEISETRLKEGTVDLVTVLQTQQTLFTAENQLVIDRLARFIAVLSLFQALGGAWLPPGVDAGVPPPIPIVVQ
jgi:NodT family efflux transporter outer membrane factor (OMF) lipoprotein